MLDRLGEELFADVEPEAVLHSELSQRIHSADGRTVLSIQVPFADRSELHLSKVGQELIVRVGSGKRTIILPTALARHRPVGARLESGTLEVSFEDDRPRRAQPNAPRGRCLRSRRRARRERAKPRARLSPDPPPASSTASSSARSAGPPTCCEPPGAHPSCAASSTTSSREALLTLRSLIDHYLERRDSDRDGRSRVEEIPID